MKSESSFVPVAILWHVTELDPPPKSGEYLVMFRSGYIRDLTYSKKHDAFNACDLGKADNSIPSHGILAWADPRNMVEHVSTCAKLAVMTKEAENYGI